MLRRVAVVVAMLLLFAAAVLFTALNQQRFEVDVAFARFVVSSGLALVIAFGVLYNAARITLAERAHELASLRVLGFRRREVGAILLGELALLVAVAIPLGLLIGKGLATLLARSPGFDSEQFRLPLLISPGTYATAVLTVVAAAVVGVRFPKFLATSAVGLLPPIAILTFFASALLEAATGAERGLILKKLALVSLACIVAVFVPVGIWRRRRKWRLRRLRAERRERPDRGASRPVATE